jgi:tetratricopeptide (TPR) repeat protein
MRLASFALALALITTTGVANAYVIIAGGSLATACSENAKNNADTAAALDQCTNGLTETLDRRSLAGTYVNRGIVYMNRRDYDRALADFDTAIRLEPTLAEGHINRGAALLSRNDYAAAIAAIDQGLELAPEEPARAYYNRGVAHEELGQIAEAYRDYRRASELAPDWSAPRTELTRFRVS